MRRMIVALTAAVSALLAAPASATASPIDGYLAVDDAASGQIYRLTQLGTDLTQLTHVTGDAFAIQPRWSADGRRITFVIVANGHDRIYTMAFDGSEVHKVLVDSAAWNNDAPDYFPSGDRIVFARCRSNGDGCVLATVGTDGTGLQTLTPERFEVYDVAPTVSPDSTRIAFIRFNADGIHARVWVMNADGTGAHPVTVPALEPYTVQWAPSGTSLLVSSNCCRLGGDLYSVSLAGEPRTRLTRTAYPNFSGSGSYAPSGREIAFLSDRNYPDKCCTDLFVMRSDGGHQVKIPVGLTGVQGLDWGPSPYA